VLPAGLRRKMRSAVFMVLLDKRSQSEAGRAASGAPARPSTRRFACGCRALPARGVS